MWGKPLLHSIPPSNKPLNHLLHCSALTTLPKPILAARATNYVISKDRVSSIIQSQKEEMQKTGVTVQLSELKNQLHKVQDLQSTSDEPVELGVRGDFFDPNAPNPEPVSLNTQPVSLNTQPTLPPKAKVKD